MPITLVLSLSSLVPAQEPSVAEREALADRYYAAPALVIGGSIEARWLDDGSSLWYRDGRRSMFVDPAQGTPRRATSADRKRVRRTTRDHPRVSVVAGNLVVHRAGSEPLALTDDEGDDVHWSLEERGWSADGALLAATRYDANGVHQLPVVDYLQAVETVRTTPYVKAGSPFPERGLAVFRVADGRRVDIALGTNEECYLFLVGWREHGDELLFLRMNREATRLDLMAADPESGASRVVLTETQETFVGGLDFVVGGWEDVFTPVAGTDEFLWLSERDGWRHVYRYGYDGQPRGRVTRGSFPVLRVAGVDVDRGHVFVVANAEERIYDTHLYRVELAGGELRRLTDGIGEHRVQLSPSARYFVDVHSSLERPPVSELRDSAGTLVCRLAQASVTGLEELGWSPPEPFVARAADGETELHGALFRPSWFDPARRYPVIDVIYSGPFMTIVPNDYGCGAPHARRAQALAQMGFIVVLLDPRGTTERSKAFQDASYGRIGAIEIPDHVAALRQVAESRPYMDMERVGVYGHSWGGYFALRAMLTAPDVFRAGVAGAPGELTEAAPINEPYMRTPQSNPEGYAAGLNAPLAANLDGALLIIHGTADVNAPLSTTMRMVDALVRADEAFDLLVLPGQPHSFGPVHERYAARRVRAHFLEHLRGERLDR